MITTSSILATGTNVVPYEIREKLCKAYCLNSSVQPTVTTSWSITDTDTVNGFVYYTLQCIVTVNYKPKGACKNCGYVTNTFVETMVFSVTSANTIALTSEADGFTLPDYTCENNCNVAKGVKHVGTLTLTVAAA